MGIENAQDFAKWSGLTGAIRNIVCLSKDKHIQDNLDSVAHIARLRRNIASALAIYEKENKEYLDTLRKTAGAAKVASQGATQGATTQVATTQADVLTADVLTPEAIAQLLAKALASQGATQTTQVKKKGK